MNELFYNLHFYSKWIIIIFEFGGLVLTIGLMRTTKEEVSFDTRKVRGAFKSLIPFILIATMSFTEMMILTFGYTLLGILLQFLNNLLTGVFFIIFLVRMKKAIIPL